MSLAPYSISLRYSIHLMPNPLKFFKLRFWLITLAFLGAVLLVGFITTDDDDLFEISKNMEIFRDLYVAINESYVDETNPTELMRTGIESMLGSLDPYTNYFSESQIEYAKLLNSGQYSGIGAEVGLKEGEVVIIELFGGGPAAAAEMHVGDVLQKIDNIDLQQEGLSLDEVRSLLLGEKGSEIKLTFQRGAMPTPITVTLERGGGEEDGEDVPYYGMINDKIGYILLTAFRGTAAFEVQSAAETLKAENPELSGLVLDLRGNPGGRLDQAVDICNLFIRQGEKIVEMRGRTLDSRNVFYTRMPPWDMEIPIAVVVNDRSASASEIVSGAIQDLDRGVIVGQLSFGKGLVQRVKPLTRSPETQMKITIAKYYTPSGRCIQALDYSNRAPDGTVSRVADSLVQAFETRNGRTVYDGGGVDPDIKVDAPEEAPVLLALESQNLIFNFASEFANQRSSIAPARSFAVTDSIYDAFTAYVEAQDFDFNTATEQQLEAMEEVLAQQDHAKELTPQLEALRDQLRAQKDQDLYRYRPIIEESLREEIIRRFYFQEGVIESSFDRDPELKAAVEVLQEPDRYQAILEGN